MLNFQTLRTVVKNMVDGKKTFGSYEATNANLSKNYKCVWDYVSNPEKEEYYNSNGTKVESSVALREENSTRLVKYATTNYSTQERRSGSSENRFSVDDRFDTYEFEHDNCIVQIKDSNRNGYIDENDSIVVMNKLKKSLLKPFENTGIEGIKSFSSIKDFLSNS